MNNSFVSPNKSINSHAHAEVLLKNYFSEKGYEKRSGQFTFSTWLYWTYTEVPFWSVECYVNKTGGISLFRGFHVHDNGEILEIEY
jgi:hypothetical protein